MLHQQNATNQKKAYNKQISLFKTIKQQVTVGLWLLQQSIDENDNRIVFEVFVGNLFTVWLIAVLQTRAGSHKINTNRQILRTHLHKVKFPSP